MTLTDEEIRIKVAEAMGWRQVEQSDGDYVSGPSPVYPWTNGKDWCDETGENLPNYPLDLNACADFEATLTLQEVSDYGKHLERIVTPFQASARGTSPLRLPPPANAA